VKKSTGTLCLLGLLFGSVVCAQEAGQRHAVDASASELHWLVFRAGLLARLGHHHTIAAGDLHGNVWKNDADLSASRFELGFSAAALVIDDPELREALGADFSSMPVARDIEATRSNMLGARVLHGAKYPMIRVVGTGPLARGGSQILEVTVEILGRSLPLTIPTRVTVDGDFITATGEFDLDHADLGMTPFSAMMGALQVGEKLSFRYSVTARRVNQ